MISVTQNSAINFDWITDNSIEVQFKHDWNPNGNPPFINYLLSVSGLPPNVTFGGFKTLDDMPFTLLTGSGFARTTRFKALVTFSSPASLDTDLNEFFNYTVTATPNQFTSGYTPEALTTSGSIRINRFEWEAFETGTTNRSSVPEINIYINNTTTIPLSVEETTGIGGVIDWELIGSGVNEGLSSNVNSLPTGISATFSNSEGDESYSTYLNANETDTNQSITLTSSNSTVEGSYRTAIKGVNRALATVGLQDSRHYQYFIFDLNILEESTIAIDNSNGITKANYTYTYIFTYTCHVPIGSNSNYDLTLSAEGHPTNTNTSFMDLSGNTITTIPFYGTTSFKVNYVTGNVTNYGNYSGLRIKFRNASEPKLFYSNNFSLHIVNAQAHGLDAFIGSSFNDYETGYNVFEIGQVTAGTTKIISIPVKQYFVENRDYKIEIDSNYIDSDFINVPNLVYVFDSNQSFIAQNLEFSIDASHPTQENLSIDFFLKDILNNDILDTVIVKYSVLGASINFSISNSKYQVAQGLKTTIDANISLEDNGVIFTDSLQLNSSNLPSGIEISMESIVPTISGSIVPITISADRSALIQRDLPVTLTLYNSTISSSNALIAEVVTIHLSIIFSSVSDYETNAITESDGIVRIHVGNNGVIKGVKAEPLWIGYIDRTFFNKLYQPEANYYIYSSWLKKFGSPSEFSFSTATGTASNFSLETHYYKIRQIFDGVQKSLLGSPLECAYDGVLAVGDTVATYKYGEFVIKIPVTDFNHRLTELEIYRSAKLRGEYSRILNIPIADTLTFEDYDETIITNNTSFTGTVKNRQTMYTDLDASFNATTYNPDIFIVDYFYNSSHWGVYSSEGASNGGVLYAEFQDHNKNWDYYQKLEVDSNGVVSVTFKTTEASDYSSSVSTTPHVNGDNLFGDTVKFQNRSRFKEGLFSSWQTGVGYEHRTEGFYATMYRGRNLIYTTTDTGTENSLVGKYIKYGTQIRQITHNKGKFIAVGEDWDGDTDITDTFTIFKSEADIKYSKITENNIAKYKIEFNDMKFSSVGSDPYKDTLSQNINGRYCLLLNGRLFQGNILLDAGKTNELNPYWVSYSELDQIDNNPVNNIISFSDKEGGEITGLSTLFNRLIVLKNRSIFIVNCPSNTSPENWFSNESIHDIGNIAPNGFISHGDVLYTIFYDGIYKLSANNIADTDKTPTTKLKITNAIQDIYDGAIYKEEIISAYNQNYDEVLFRWYRNPKNLVRNSDFASGASSWNLIENGGFGASISNVEKYSGNFSAQIEADGTLQSTGEVLTSDLIKVDRLKAHTISVYAKCPILEAERFYISYTFHDENKTKIGSHSNLKIFYSSSSEWQRYSKVITDMPIGTYYVQLKSYWYTSAGSDFPKGKAYVDQWQIEENAELTGWEHFEKSQEVYAYNVITSNWREIYTNGSIGKFSLDYDNSVIYWDNRDHKIKSFNNKESVEASIVTNPISLTNDRYEMVRKLSTKIKSSDNLTVNIIGDGDTDSKTTQTIQSQSKPTLEKKNLRKKCKDVQLEIISPASTNDVEIHKIELEYN